jgi:hypothetical protein
MLYDQKGSQILHEIKTSYFEEWCLLGCYAVKTSNLTRLLTFFTKSTITTLQISQLNSAVEKNAYFECPENG